MTHRTKILTLTTTSTLILAALLLLLATTTPPLALPARASEAATTNKPTDKPANQLILINELDAQTPGTDQAELIELYDGGTGDTPLDGLILVLFNGGDENDASYRAIDLDGHATDANGYFVLGNAAVPHVDLTIGDGTLQNGPDAAALYSATVDAFPNGTPPTTTHLVDALVYDEYNDDDPALRALLLNPGQPVAYEADTAANAARWSTGRCPDGSAAARDTHTHHPGQPSPGAANHCPARPDLTITKAVQAAAPLLPGDPVTYTITLANHEALTYTVHLTDTLPHALLGADLDQVAQLPAHTQRTFTLPATLRADDAGLRGQTVTNTAHVSYTFHGTLDLVVRDQASATFTIASRFEIYLPTLLRSGSAP